MPSPQLLKQMTAELLWLTWGRKIESHLLSFFLPLFFSPFPSTSDSSLQGPEAPGNAIWKPLGYNKVTGSLEQSLRFWFQHHSREEHRMDISRAIPSLSQCPWQPQEVAIITHLYRWHDWGSECHKAIEVWRWLWSQGSLIQTTPCLLGYSWSAYCMPDGTVSALIWTTHWIIIKPSPQGKEPRHHVLYDFI